MVIKHTASGQNEFKLIKFNYLHYDSCIKGVRMGCEHDYIHILTLIEQSLTIIELSSISKLHSKKANLVVKVQNK